MPGEPTSAAALEAFLAGVERRALRIAQVTTRDREEALDVVQDAMLRLARRYHARPPDEWPALFHRILINRLRDWQRSRRLRAALFFWRTESDDENDTDPVDQAADPQALDGASELQRDQLLARLETTLAALPARQREAFQLRVWEGMSVEEAARAMGCSTGSVKTHLFRAMQVLRTELEYDSEPEA